MAQAQTPALQPCQEFLLLLIASRKVKDDVDIALRAGGCILRASEQIQPFDAEPCGMKALCNALDA